VRAGEIQRELFRTNHCERVWGPGNAWNCAAGTKKLSEAQAVFREVVAIHNQQNAQGLDVAWWHRILAENLARPDTLAAGGSPLLSSILPWRDDALTSSVSFAE